jgi:hypothetical protein
MEKGLPEVVMISLDKWQCIHSLDYEQLPFKCKICHEYRHFVRKTARRWRHNIQWRVERKNNGR